MLGRTHPGLAPLGREGQQHWQATSALQDVAPARLQPQELRDGWGVGSLCGRGPLHKGPKAQTPWEDHAAADFSRKIRGRRGTGGGMLGEEQSWRWWLAFAGNEGQSKEVTAWMRDHDGEILILELESSFHDSGPHL